MRTRNHRFSLWLNEKEFTHLTIQAQNAGLKKEPFIRKLIMDIEIHPRPTDNISQLIREVNAIGNNINQIARKVNAFNEIEKKELYEIHKLLGEIYRTIKR